MATIFTPSAGALNADDLNASTSLREVCTISANGQGQLRATFTASSSTGLTVAHASIGKWYDTGEPDTTATPLELKFSTASGFSISSGASITSDWVDASSLSLTSGDAVVVIMDITTPGGVRYRSGNSNVNTWYKVGGTSWNVAAPGVGAFGYSANNVFSVASVETQSGATNASVSVTGSAGTGSVGTVTVSTANTRVNVTGFSGTSALGTVTFPTGSGKPEWVASYEPASNWTDIGGSIAVTRTTSSFNVQNGDLLVVGIVTEDNSYPSGAPTGGSLTYTQRALPTGADYTYLAVYSAPVTSSASMTVSVTSYNGSGHAFGFVVHHWRNSTGVGNVGSGQGTGGPSQAVTTASANSGISVFSGDWNAADGTTRTWRTVNSITPTSGNGLERVYYRNASTFGVYSAYYDDAGTTASKTTGLSAPTGQKYRIAAIEVKGGNSPNISTNVVGIDATAIAGSVTINNGYKTSVTGSAATSSVGTVSPSTQHKVSVTGVSGTGSVGTVTFSLGTGASVNLTGVSGTSSVGTVVAGSGILVNATGTAATSSLGTPTVLVGGAIAATGFGATASVGTATAKISTVVDITGPSATGSVGTITSGGASVIPVTGNSATSGVGFSFVVSEVNVSVSVTGSSSTSSVGTINIFDPIFGVEGTASLGSVSVKYAVAVEVDGLEIQSGTEYPRVPAWSFLPDSKPNFWIPIT